MAENVTLPAGFVLDEPQEEPPQGFVVDEPTVGERLAGAGEVALTLATGAPAEIASGLVGVGGLVAEGVEGVLRSFGLERAAQFFDPGDLRTLVEGVQESLTNTPDTPEGQRQMQALGKLLQPVANLMESASQTLGDVGFQAAGPAGGAIAGSIPQVAAELIPATAAFKGGRQAISRIRGTTNIPEGGSWLFGKESPGKSRIRKAIETGEDAVISKYVIDGSNKVRANPAGRAALRQGVDEGIVGPLSAASKADKTAVSGMLDLIEKGKKSKQFRTFNRPSDILGNTVVSRYNALKKLNKEAAGRLDDVAKGLSGKKADLDDALGEFFDDLETLGVTIDEDFKPVYADLSIEEIASSKNFIEKTLRRLDTAGTDAEKLHKLKKLIDEDVAFGKTGEGLTGNTERIVKKLRRNINTSLQELSPEYKEVNTQFADTRQSMDLFAKASGSKFNPDSPNVNKQVGQRARLLMGRRQARTDVIDSLYDMNKTAEKYGITFDDNIGIQAAAVDELERLFPSFAPTSFEGQIERGVSKVVSAQRRGLVDVAVDVGAAGAKKVLGRNEKNLIKSLRKLLETE